MRKCSTVADPLDCGGRSSDCRRNVTCGLSGGRPSQYFEGDALVLINKGATPMDKNADLLIQQPIGQVLGSIKVR